MSLPVCQRIVPMPEVSKKGKLPGTGAEQTGMNDVLKKLSDSERDILAELIIDVYHSGIYDTLEKLEWPEED